MWRYPRGTPHQKQPQSGSRTAGSKAACMGASKKGQRPENENVETQDPSGPAVKTTRGTGTLLEARVSVLIPTYAVQTAA